jgi:hypothetical protein
MKILFLKKSLEQKVSHVYKVISLNFEWIH